MVARATSAKAEPAPEKPHYHDRRARPRQRFDEAGAAVLSDYELLELMLFRTIPRQDTKPLAEALLAKFDSLSAVLAAPVQRIAEVKGAGPSVAQDLKVAQAIMARASKSELAKRTVITSWPQLVNYCRMSMAGEPRAIPRAFPGCQESIIADEVMNEGAVDHAPVYPREVARRALELSAASVILVHDHPSGDPKPSAADLAITREIVAAAQASVRVHDHLVIGRDGVSSFKTLGLL